MTKTPALLDLRPARLRDYRAIQRIRRAAAEKLTADFGAGEWSHISWFGTLERGLIDKTLYALWQDDEIVGTCSLTTIPIDFYNISRFSQPNAAAFYLRSLSIAPEKQRQNIGRAAMHLAEAIARGRRVSSLRLDTAAASAGAAGFYLRCGYTEAYEADGLRFFEKILKT